MQLANLANDFHTEYNPSNQITEEEADAHEDLMHAVFKRDGDAAAKRQRKEQHIPLNVTKTFMYELNQKRDFVVGAYESREGIQEAVLVGGLIATKYRSQEDNEFGFRNTFVHINAIYVAADYQRKGIGKQMTQLLQGYTKRFPLVVCVGKSNTEGQKFWDDQREFTKLTGKRGNRDHKLLEMSYEAAPLEPKTVVAYYSENDSGKVLVL